ncbi:MAG: hypothetical protein WD845_08500 [Pirellulales bacterium]
MKQNASIHSSHENDSALGARHRVVLIGASNLTKGIGTVMGLAHHAFGQRLELHVAQGHGRSYGAPSSLFGRQLPGIVQCGLWPALDRRTVPATSALVTDIGNDILYEQPVEQIAEWVEIVLDRLVAMGARTVVTLLPEENLPKISQARFLLMRSILVPRCRLSLETISERVRALNLVVRKLGSERGCTVVAQRSEWYGFDPIHIRFFHRAGAWGELLGAWFGPATSPSGARNMPLRTAYLRIRAPEARRLWGI